MLFDILLLICLGFPAFVIAQGSLWPAALPLAVRSPYLNSYFNSVAGAALPNQWPTLWSENKILGWSGWIRVDGTTYELWGQSGTATNLTNVEITPTHTKLSITADTMDVNVTWLSPIEPSNLALQSLPFSYISLEASSNDGATHTIQFYSDISCEWVSGDSASLARWNTTKSTSTTYHMCTRQSPQTATEIDNMVEDASVYYSTLNNDDASYQTGNDSIVRGDFRTNGGLFNSLDTNFRAIDQNFVVLGHAVDLGSISSTSSPVVFALGLVRDPAIIMATPSGNQTRSSYFFSEYGTVGDAIDFFLGDFDNAQQRADDLDDKLLSEANGVSTDYADLVSLAARQALAVDITVSQSSDGTFNTSDVMTFMRDTGNSRRTNPVEVIYAAFPAFLYFNATWAGSLLAPLLKYQASSLYSRSYAAPDLGASYPYAAGNSNPNIFGALEDSADMLIMGWAHARFSGDGSMLSEYYSLYKNFAGYMISNNVVKPSGYSDADGVDNTNMTNLAIKGILGIKAMSEISSALGQDDDASTYSEQASSFYDQWKSLADSQGHLVSTYNELSSWALIYNLFADKLLGTKLVDDSIYTQQDTFYASQADVAGSHGFLYDSTVPDQVKSHWTMFTAAAASDSSVRDTLISMVHTQAASNESAGVFPTTYSADNGTAISGQASPAQGAMFSVLALNLKAQSVSASLDGKSKKSNTGAIVGGVVGGLAVVALAVLGFFLWRRRQRQKQERSDSDESPWGTKHTTQQMMSVGPDYSPQQQMYNPYEDHPHGQPGHAPSHSISSTTYSSAPSAPAPAPPLPVPIISNMHPAPQSGKAGLVHLAYGTPTLTDRTRTYSSGTSNPDSDHQATQLRSEVDNLRREMEEMRARTQYEPPPQYT